MWLRTVAEQNMVLPDVQLEPGQVLVILEDENGQSQLMIVNEADMENMDADQLLQAGRQATQEEEQQQVQQDPSQQV